MEHSLNRLLVAAILATAITPGIGQTEDTPYFALSSAKTFAPGENASVQLNAYGIDALDFRVYHVDDPVKFFEQLDDSHTFGGRAPQPKRELTAIERFHRFKHRWRMRMINFVREQYDPDTRAMIRDAMARRAQARNVARYAEAPLLNSRQVVATWSQPVTSRDRWSMQTVPVETHGKGVYLVEAAHKDLRAYTILIVSATAMITKTAPGRVLAWLVDRQTGAALPNADVVLWNGTQRTAAQSWKTNTDGIVDAKIEATKNDDLRLLARSGDDFTAASLSGYSVGGRLEQDWTGYIYTDRPVYRPGHTVNFRAIARTQSANGYTIPSARQLDITVDDPDQKTIYHKQLPVSKLGTVHDSLTVPAGASLGYYSIQIHQEDAYMQGGFQVEEYKKPEYEVRVTPAKPRVIEGETVQATIDARYYFGEPVKNAKVVWSVYRGDAWLKHIEQEQTEGGDANTGDQADDEGDSGDQLQNQEGRLDDNGRLTISFPTQVSKDAGDYRYRIEAKVTDQGNREISGTGWLNATYTSFYLTAQPDGYVFAVGGRARIQIGARDYDDKPVRAHVKAELQEWTPVRKGEERRAVTRATAEADTDANGDAKVEFTIPHGGEWRVLVTAPTPEQRTVQDQAYLWVNGGYAALFGEPEANIRIVPDQKKYKDGDTAHVLVITGVPRARVLVSAEGKQIEWTRVMDAGGPSFTVDVPIHGDDAPSVYVTASFIQKNQFYQGSKLLKIPPVTDSLTVKLASGKPQYQPGDHAVYDLDVSDSAGRPVNGAEFSLGVVDEAIYAIRKDTTPDILNFFYGRDWNIVNTDSSLSYWFRGEAGKRRMQLAALFAHRHPMTQLKPERLIQPKVRKAFPDTAYWAADLTTNAQGHAEAQFDFPDSLTTWRATARGVTADTKVGAAVEKTIVRKNIIVRLVTPRFFTQGDEMTLSVLVHNYLPDAKTARVSLDARGLEIIGGATQDVTVASRGDVKLDWRVRVPAGTEAVITGKALTDQESDAMELTIPIWPQGVKLSDARSGSLNGGGNAEFRLTFPGQVAPASRRIEIRLAPSIAGTLFGALDYLTSYPWGCTEQTMSSFLPDIVVSRALKDLNLKSTQDPATLQQKIGEGLDRLYDFQHEDGGWGWWKTDDSSMFMTAYVVSGLAQAQAAGQTIKPEAVQKGAAWLKAFYGREPRLVADSKAYVAWSLALADSLDPATLDDVWTHRAKLTPYGEALLGLTLDQKKDPRAHDIAQHLETEAKQNDIEAWWTEESDPLLDIWFDSSPETTAFVLKLLVHQDPRNALVPKAALWLTDHRSGGSFWYSTEQTAMVVNGLADYLKLTQELNPAFTATVLVNGKQVGTKTFGGTDALEPGDTIIALNDAQLDPASNDIHIEMKGTGRLYWSVRQDYASLEPKLAKTGTVELNILRDYFRLTPATVDGKIVYDLNPLNGPVAVGDTLAVRLTVSGGPWRYLQIEDPIPAGAEFIERDDLYNLRDKPSWWGWWFTRREMHDNRMGIFQTYFSKGQQQYVYLLKVVNPGVFHVNPARVQPMYEPKYLSTTEAKTVEAK